MLRNLELYLNLIKSNISTFSEFKLNLFSTVLFATLKTALKKYRYQSGTVQIYQNRTETGTGPNKILSKKVTFHQKM